MAKATRKTVSATAANGKKVAAPVKKTAPQKAEAKSAATNNEGVTYASVYLEPDGALRARVPAAALRDLGVSKGQRLKFTRERKGVWTLGADRRTPKK